MGIQYTIYNKLNSSGAIAALILLNIGCAKSDPLAPLNTVFESVKSTSNVEVNFCTDPSYNQKQVLKEIIILDHSGSNKTNYLIQPGGNGGPKIVNGTIIVDPKYATDPTGTTRYGTPTSAGTLLNFLSTLAINNPTNVMNPKYYFSVINFSSDAAAYPNTGFTTDLNALYTDVLTDSGQTAGLKGSPSDVGSTNYLAALHMAQQLITDDIAAAEVCAAQPVTSAPTAGCETPGVQTASDYVIIFMSDGAPVTSISGVGVDASGKIVTTNGPIAATLQNSGEILAAVSAIADFQSNPLYVSSVNLFTIYYYNPLNIDDAAQQLLLQMASAGNGVSYNAISGTTSIDYNSFQPPAKRITFNLKDIFVTNSSAAWNGPTLAPDTDGDGLSDQFELSTSGTVATMYSSNNDGISDLTRYLYANSGNQSSLASTLSNLCSNLPMVGGFYVASDPNGFNDCEKVVLNDAAGINNPDSNSDDIPDWLEAKNGVPFQAGTSPAVNTPDQDGYSIYDKIKLSLPVKIPVSQLLDPQPSVYAVKLMSSDATQNCYNVNVTNFPTVSATDKVRVDIIMKSEQLRQTFLYKVGAKAFTAGSKTVIFNDWNDPAEQLAGTWKMWP